MNFNYAEYNDELQQMMDWLIHIDRKMDKHFQAICLRTDIINLQLIEMRKRMELIRTHLKAQTRWEKKVWHNQRKGAKEASIKKKRVLNAKSKGLVSSSIEEEIERRTPMKKEKEEHS